MGEEFSVSVEVPLDGSGFLRRECPSCNEEFKWFNHEQGNPDAEHADQYFCPRCGKPAGLDQWWTSAQATYLRDAAAPEFGKHMDEILSGALGGLKGLTFTPNTDLTMPDPLIEPDDMVIAEPPCHPNEPVKVPESATSQIYCLICGTPFAV
jgi:hypothetical protein